MAEATDKITEIGLVLQGGGALGAYECGGVVALLDLIDEAVSAGRTVVLKAVSGVSIGAINAACVVGATDRADARRRIEALWDDFTLIAPDFWPHAAQRDLALFGLPGFYWPRSDYLNMTRWKSYYDTSPLRNTLERYVDFAALNKSPTQFFATAVNVESGEVTTFSNRRVNGETVAAIDPLHIMASGALPPQFPWITIGGQHYWDGGIVDNAPLDDAVNAFSQGDDVTRVLVVMNLYPLKAPLPQSMTEVDARVHSLSYGNRMRQDRAIANYFNQFISIIEELADGVPDGVSLPPELARRVDWARSFKTIQIVDIDMQESLARLDSERRVDGEFGLRDFSASTLNRRRQTGYAQAHKSLKPYILSAQPVEPV
ncbi:MAG: patatin-like phospholipase family protein [Proteobacteria bacterium]|nr:patatin-like phospholipase family protein [Pseudomonadota bacterium]